MECNQIFHKKCVLFEERQLVEESARVHQFKLTNLYWYYGRIFVFDGCGLEATTKTHRHTTF